MNDPIQLYMFLFCIQYGILKHLNVSESLFDPINHVVSSVCVCMHACVFEKTEKRRERVQNRHREGEGGSYFERVSVKPASRHSLTPLLTT